MLADNKRVSPETSLTGSSLAGYNKKIENWQLSRLKCNCLITVISLLERLDL